LENVVSGYASTMSPIAQAAAAPRHGRNSTDNRHWIVGLLVTLSTLTVIAIVVGWQLPRATGADAELSTWFVSERTPLLNRTTAFFSAAATTSVIVAIGVSVVLVSLLRRAYDGVVLVFVAMAGEIAMFLIVVWAVDRPRPAVAQLDSAPPTSSFPSGHTLATFVLWTMIAVLAVVQSWRPTLVFIARALAVVMPAAVGLSRVYRGMHHPTDVVASMVLGLIWTTAVVVLFRPSPIGLSVEQGASTSPGSPEHVRARDEGGDEHVQRTRIHQ
jgi:undecaprenyl-diphosphatase